MADLDEEFARFQAELETVEAEAPPTEPENQQDEQLADFNDELARFEAEIAGVAVEPPQTDLPPPARPPPSTLPPPHIPPPVTAAEAKPIIAAPAQVSAPAQRASSPQQQLPLSIPPPPGPPPSYTNNNTAAYAGGSAYQQQQQQPGGKKVAIVRSAAGDKWLDQKLAEWPENDFRIFVGNLGHEVNDTMLTQAFQHYSSFQMARVIRDSKTNKGKGYGFVSLGDPADGVKALREMHQKYIGNRPVQLKHSKWEKRNVTDKKGKTKKRVVGDKQGEPAPKRHHSVLHK